jgi:predicted phosphodiesterase
MRDGELADIPMIALMADIHGNREALTACLADAERRGVPRIVFLGDLVGYGADPGWVVDRVVENAAPGAIVLRGNHDAAVTNPSVSMNETAAAAMDWTRDQLNWGAARVSCSAAAAGGGGRPALCPCQRRRA